MNIHRLICAATTALAIAAPAWSVTAEEHAAHHPDQGASAAAATPAPQSAKAGKSTPSTAAKKSAQATAADGGICMHMSKETSQAMDKQMQAMQNMHDKMTAAKTPDEKRALLGEQMKTMQDGMAMMDQMGMSTANGPKVGMSGMSAPSASAPMPAASTSGAGMGQMSCMHGHHDMMASRMKMMESMMRMVMDRMAVDTTK